MTLMEGSIEIAPSTFSFARGGLHYYGGGGSCGSIFARAEAVETLFVKVASADESAQLRAPRQ